MDFESSQQIHNHEKFVEFKELYNIQITEILSSPFVIV